MIMTAYFAWANGGLLCGQCHFMMDCSVSKNDFPVEFRTECRNPKCPAHGKVFRVPISNAIQLEEV